MYRCQREVCAESNLVKVAGELLLLGVSSCKVEFAVTFSPPSV